ncbi:MAG TPA: hypothetical protein VH092_10550, partial [Urbifossiella sp.]|nr:hypothetical protein [Urbifossiella sp.]
MIRIPGLLCLGLCMAAGAGADEPDPVKAKLDKAVAVHAAEMEAFRTKAGTWLDERENAARRAGDKKALDRIKLEREAFDRTDVLPAGAPPDLKRRGVDARAKLVRAYTEGVKDYTRAKKDPEAAALEKEVELIKLGIDPADGRCKWVHPKGAFRIVRRGVWEEAYAGAPPLTWTEVGRTRQYVELTITGGGKKYYARLYDMGD